MTPGDDITDKDAPGPAPDDGLIDAALRRALDDAPDRAAQPDSRLRKAILKAGRDAVMPSATTPTRDAGRATWWQRLWRGGGNSRLPWNAAFATVLVATLVTVMWRSEPVPDARLDGEAQAAAPSPSEVAPVAPASPVADAPPRAREKEQKTEPSPALPSESAAPAQSDEATPAAEEASNAMRKRSAVLRQAQKRRAQESAAPADTADALADIAPPAPDAQRAPSLRRSLEAPPAASAARPAPAAPDIAVRRAAPSIASGGAVEGARGESTEPPTFAALAQWDRLVIADAGGARRSLSRDEATELRALMGSVAMSAVAARSFAGPVAWRLTMERDGQVLAVLELGDLQVRWREGAAPPATGVPSAGALSALRAALSATSAAQPEAGPR